MELSSERPRTRWIALILTCGLAAGLLFEYGRIMQSYLTIVGQLGLRGAPEASTPFKQAYPAFAADAQTWVRHSLSLLEGDSLRLRHTNIDNAPAGREVHWNSAWAWTIVATGWLDHWLTGVPLLTALERITIWLTPGVLTLLIVVLSFWCARRAGAAAGVVVAIAMVGHPRVFEGFYPSYVDHHGLLSVAILGMMLGATFMGAGWWRPQQADGLGRLLPDSPEQARRGAAASALSGAFGMWISAASVIPPIAIVGITGLLVLVLRGRDARGKGDQFDPAAWRTWGRVGAGASLLFYLLEYFPNHLGLRLESNHPFYSLAWWGAGEFIAQAGEWWLEPAARRWSALPRLAGPLAAVAIAPLTIAVGGPKVFVVIDPFLSQLHRQHIQEFLPLWKTMAGTGWKTFFSVVGTENIPLIVGAIALVRLGRGAPLLLWFGTLAAGLFTAMAWMQSRWLLNASGSQISLTLVLLAFFFGGKKMLIRSLGAVGVGMALFLPTAITRITGGAKDVAAKNVGPKDAQATLCRDVAAVIRSSQPSGDVVLLTSPNSSTAVGYYGMFKTLGTLYWENVDGLKAAAAILSAHTNEEAAELIRKHGVTHIAMISEENFVGPYYQLLHPDAKPDDVKKSFGYRILVERVVPQWLQMIPYNVPDDLKPLNVSALLLKVAFGQSQADALYYVALAKVAMGQAVEAERDFDTLIQLSPASYQPWMRKGELLFLRQDWDGAANSMLQGVQRAPENLRLDLLANAASKFFRERKHAQAVRIYRSALQMAFVPQLASYLAFVLATSSDDAVRNGVEALELAERALKSDPNSPTLLNSLAAALAENGRFPEAVEAAERALANARVQRQDDAIRVSETRLAAFKAGKRWRE